MACGDGVMYTGLFQLCTQINLCFHCACFNVSMQNPIRNLWIFRRRPFGLITNSQRWSVYVNRVCRCHFAHISHPTIPQRSCYSGQLKQKNTARFVRVRSDRATIARLLTVWDWLTWTLNLWNLPSVIRIELKRWAFTQQPCYKATNSFELYCPVHSFLTSNWSEKIYLRF
jgi:hypothetical protein